MSQSQSTYKPYSIGKTFDLNIPIGIEVKGFAEKGPFVPRASEEYIFRRELVRDVCAFLKYPHGDALFVTGPTGSGKTSGITEIAARLNWPVQQITANGRMEFSDLVGHHALVSPSPGETPVMKFQYGPLPTAMKEGHILLINEVDMIDPAELSGLNDILEGRPLVIVHNGGEIIEPHEMFRVVVTGNSVGSGDHSGLYQGVNCQNLAAMDRYRFIEVSYPTEHEEKAILKRLGGDISDSLLDGMIHVANNIRSLFVGDESECQLSITMSTRGLVRWYHLTQNMKGASNALKLALDSSLLIRARSEERIAIEKIASNVFGAQWKGEA